MNTTLDARLTAVRPHPRQAAHQQLEFYAFIHFTVNTFTGLEWGNGTESPAIFDPGRLDTRQWVEAIKAAGMRGLILTCKHHDGFCLWPSRYTSHTVAASPYKSGRGDIVREVSDACREAGLKFGVYLSPWDRNQPCYGSGREYDDFYIAQLTELLTGYGEIFSVWLDGACGEGPNGRRQYYDWARYYETVRRLQPGACISVCGPDVRWCGNEAGDTRESEWSVVPLRTQDTERIASASQQSDDAGFRGRKITASDRDLGSRAILADEPELCWYPAEVDTSIRPGWFYHPEEDGQVKTPRQLFELYMKSVGGNSSFLLNIPPTPEGLLHPNDVESLHGLGRLLRAAFGTDLADSAQLTASSCATGHDVEALRRPGYDAFYRPAEGSACRIDVSFPTETPVSYLTLQENILLSQRIERFRVLGDGQPLYEGTVVGYKKIVPLPEGCRVRELSVEIMDAREFPTLAFLGVY